MPDENLEFVRSWWARFNESGLPPLDLCDPQIEVRIPDDFPFTGIYHGHEGVREWAAEVFDVIEDHRVAVEEVIQAAGEDTVFMVLRSTGRSMEMQMAMEVPWAAVWVIRDGKLVHAHGYLNVEEARAAARLQGE